ncbi:MAG TPA: polymer-forming cytoskeletal protein, partial [Dehalococcoidia bacterium]|nr:polymer-forming cytoskeletal protein [Dehalococcoidia bacterium]
MRGRTIDSRQVPLSALVAVALSGLLLAGCQKDESTARKFRSENILVVPASETVEGDLYATGQTVTINGTIKGDLAAAGSTVTVNGTVEGDVAAAAGQVTISGAVHGDIRAAGGTVTITGPVDEDVLAAAGSLSVEPGAKIGRDLYFGAGSANVAGSIRGDVVGSTQDYNRSGTVGGQERVRIEARAEKAKKPAPTAMERLVDRLRTLAGLLLVGLLLIWLRPRWIEGLSERITSRPWASLGWGLLTWVGVPFGILLLTVAWILLAVVLGVLSLGGLVGAVVISGLLADAALVLALVLSAAFLAWVIVGLGIGQFTFSRLLA